MATIDKRIGKNGAVSYRARVRTLGHVPRAKSFSRLSDAKLWAVKTESALKTGQHVPTREADRRTVANLIDRYVGQVLPTKRHNKDRKKVAALLGWWKGRLVGYSVANLTPDRIAECRDELRGGTTRRGGKRSGATVNRYLAALSAALKYAIQEWGWIKENPIRRVAKCAESLGRERYLTDDERDRFLEECRASDNRYLYPIVVLALTTGARYSEIVSLRWPQVDLGRRAIRLLDTKNSERRSLPIVAQAAELLAELAKVRRLDTDLIFPGRNPKRPVYIRTHFEQALARAGIEDFTFHGLRHTCASYLAMQGCAPSEIAAVLGHKTLAMVKRYSHLSDQHTAGVLDRLADRMFGGDRSTKP